MDTITPKQFDFAGQWQSKIVPHLGDPDVVTPLTLGMKLCDINYDEGAPPWLSGRGILNGQQAVEGSLSWYQPWGRSHHIAPFCWALGQKVFPELHWGFVSGDKHTVVIGWSDDWEQPEWVMDILRCEEWSAQQSLDFAKERNWKYYDSLARYTASFFAEAEREEAHEIIEQMKEHDGNGNPAWGTAEIEFVELTRIKPGELTASQWREMK
jgi:hypothetical protein